MVNMKMVLSPTGKDDGSAQKIKLEPEQASKVPFPPGCPVVILEHSRILCSGEVTAVYISFAHKSGSCDNCYEVVFTDLKGNRGTLVVRGGQLRYGIDCPITISPPTDNALTGTEVFEGVIKGFETQQSEHGTEDSEIDSCAFLYTVEVSAAVNDGQEGLYRQRGIGPEHIRFRPTMKSSYLQDGKSTIVSFDETTASSTFGKDDRSFSYSDNNKMQLEKVPMISTSPEACPSPHFTPTMSNMLSSPRQHPGQHMAYEQQQQQIHGKSFTKCVTLPSPVPNHFQGDMAKSRGEKVPEFTFLVNFPLCNKQAMLPPGKRCCVMCGELCWASPSNRSKGKNSHESAFIPNQNKGLCTHCDVNIWVVKESGMQIKWCKGCKNFQTWASFGEKGSATKCMRCRDRQREKYALTKGLKADKSGGTKRKALDSEAAESKKRASSN